MKIFIVGSLLQQNDIEALADLYRDQGNAVEYIVKISKHFSDGKIAANVRKKIIKADRVVAVQKSDGSYMDYMEDYFGSDEFWDYI